LALDSYDQRTHLIIAADLATPEQPIGAGGRSGTPPKGCQEFSVRAPPPLMPTKQPVQL
jgi:hypothetical protein